MDHVGVQTCALNTAKWTIAQPVYTCYYNITNQTLQRGPVLLQHTNKHSALHISLTLSCFDRSTAQCVGSCPLLSSLALVLWTSSSVQSTGCISNLYTAATDSRTVIDPHISTELPGCNLLSPVAHLFVTATC
jgi:hypothetical protein